MLCVLFAVTLLLNMHDIYLLYVILLNSNSITRLLVARRKFCENTYFWLATLTAPYTHT